MTNGCTVSQNSSSSWEPGVPSPAAYRVLATSKICPRIVWKNDLGQSYSDSGISRSDMSQDFRSMPLTTLIAGGFKLDQILDDPYQTFYSTLSRHVHEASSVLIAGYGFGDLHVNIVLRNRFKGPKHDDRPHLQVVILEKSCPQRYRTARLETHQF